MFSRPGCGKSQGNYSSLATCGIPNKDAIIKRTLSYEGANNQRTVRIFLPTQLEMYLSLLSLLGGPLLLAERAVAVPYSNYILTPLARLPIIWLGSKPSKPL